MIDRSTGDELGIGGRDGFAHFSERHPVDTESLGCRCLVAAIPNISGSTASGFSRSLSCVATIDTDNGPMIVRTFRDADGEIGLEETMPLKPAPLSLKPKHGAAKHERVAHGPTGFFDVLYNPEGIGPAQMFTNLLDEKRRAYGTRCMPHCRISLARRAGPDEIEAIGRERQRVSLVKFERVIRLWFDIDTDNFEARSVKAHTGAASAAEQIKCAKLSHSTNLAAAMPMTMAMMISVAIPRDSRASSWRDVISHPST